MGKILDTYRGNEGRGGGTVCSRRQTARVRRDEPNLISTTYCVFYSATRDDTTPSSTNGSAQPTVPPEATSLLHADCRGTRMVKQRRLLGFSGIKTDSSDDDDDARLRTTFRVERGFDAAASRAKSPLHFTARRA